MEWSLVGRDDELERFGRLLSRGPSEGIVLVGDIGVGKTRLAHAMSEEALSQGYETAWVTATRSASTIPFGAFAHLLPMPSHVVLDRPGLLKWALEELAEGHQRPLVLAVDDAHLLDNASAALLHHFAVERLGFLLVTIRADASSPDAIDALWRSELLERINLGPLTRAHCDHLLTRSLDAPVDDDSKTAIWQLTEGNPLFLRYLVETAKERGTLVEENGVWRLTSELEVPEQLTEMMMMEQIEESGKERLTLEVLAVGDTVEFALLEQLAVPESLEILEERGLIVVDRSGHRLVVRMSHPIYGEILRDVMPTARRRIVAAELAETLRHTGMRRQEDLLRWATWTLESGNVLDAELAVTAARRALALFDHQLAERLAAAVADSDHRFEALLLLGEARRGLDRPEDAETVLTEALSIARSEGQRARATLARARNLAWAQGRLADAISVLQEAIQQVTEDRLELELTAELTLYLGIQGDFGRVLQLTRQVEDHSSLSEMAVLNTMVVATLAQSLLGRLEGFDQRLEHGERLARDLAEQAPLAGDQLGLNRVMGRMCQGNLLEALVLAEEGTAASEERKQPLGVWGLTLGLILMLRGDLRRALEVIKTGTGHLREFDPFANLGIGIALRATTHAQMDEPEEARAVLEQWDPGASVPRRTQVWLDRARAWVTAADDVAEGSSVAVEGGRRAIDESHVTWGAIVLHDAVRMGHPQPVIGDLERLRGNIDCDLLHVFASHARALTEGRVDALAEVSRAFEGMGSLLYAAEAAAQAALIRAETDQEQAARRLAARSAFLSEQCPGARTPASVASPAWSTPREAEVAGLAARGLASRQIADRLSLSVRTVDNHLRSVYRKLGISGRHELTEILAGDDP